MRHSCIIWLFLAAALAVGIFVELSVSGSQWGTISGRVTDGLTGDPVAKATVTIQPAGASISTPADGRFSFTRLNPGTFSLVVVIPGFQRYEKKGIVITAGASVEIAVSLLRDTAAYGQRNSEEKGLVGKLKDYLFGEKRDDQSRTGRLPVSVAPKTSSDSYNQGSASSGDYKQSAAPALSMPLTRTQPVPSYDYEYQSLPPFDMYYHDYGTNNFVDTRRDRLSTFGADINDASYTLVRRYLNDGNVPPTDAVRVEEFINHFDYGYNPPNDGKFRIFSELAASPFDSRTSYLKIGIKGREISEWKRKPMAITAVIDISGSMGYDNRFQVLKESMRLLADRLDSRDKIAIVAYNTYARVALRTTSGDDRRDIDDAMNSLYPGGSTNAEAGLKLGYQLANEQFTDGYTNLVILLSDGVANVGQTSSEGIMGQINRYARKGLTLSSFGYGMGNYNDALLEQLARKGNGSYAYIDDYAEAQKLFADGIVGTVQTLARDVKIQVEFNPEAVSSYRLLGYEKRAIPDQNFRDNRQDGGEIKAGHEVTALYELVLNNRSEDNHIATINVRWKNLAQDEVTEVSQEVNWNGRVQRFESARPEFRLAVAASRFAETLKQTRYVDGCFDRLLPVAQRISYDLPNEETRELVSLIQRAREMTVGFGLYRED